MDRSRVAVFGGGIAGLTAAHELAQRGFMVTVYESRKTFGGKARSIDVPRSSRDGRAPLPGEHGFRLFPAFYRHVPDTMARIPCGQNRSGVLDNLVSVDRTLVASAGRRSLRFPVHAPKSRFDVAAWTAALVDATEASVPVAETLFFVHRMLVLLTSCDERREHELDNVTWWEFMGAKARSPNYQRYLAGGLTRSLVAMKAEESSARTIGLIAQALMLDTLAPGRTSDRVLNAPTNSAWIDPWLAHLRTLGVRFRRGSVSGLRMSGGRIGSAIVRTHSGYEEVSAGEYVIALPYEILNDILTDEVREAAPSLQGLQKLRSEWMNGIQYYLDRDVPLIDGHCVLLDSPWALTAISQRQFWTGTDLSRLGAGNIEGIISVDISDWNSPGVLFGRPAKECSALEISKEVWAQLKMHLNVNGATTLHDSALVKWFLDPAIVFKGKRRPSNTEPLLINTVGSLKHRPHAQTEIENLYVCGDFVRTHTDLATMEAANESARRATNAILDRAGAHYSRCDVWRLPEPEIFAPLRALDELRFRRGQRHPWYDESADSLKDVFRNRLSGFAGNLARLWRGENGLRAIVTGQGWQAAGSEWTDDHEA